MESIGSILKQEREKRGLSIEDVHETTKITVQNLSALEEDKFDYFPNKVYARAFLRDYANFLGLDSAELVGKYEQNWGQPKEPEAAVVENKGASKNVVGYVVIALLVIAILAVTAYYGWSTYEKKGSVPKVSIKTPAPPRSEDVATIPKPIAPAKPIAAPKPANTKPVPKTAAVSDKLTLEVTPTTTVWARVKVDGKKVFEGMLSKGSVKTYEGKKNVFIRVGKAGAVQLKLNGQMQPSLGSLGAPGEKTFTLPAQTSGQSSAAAPTGDSAAQPKTQSKN